MKNSGFKNIALLHQSLLSIHYLCIVILIVISLQSASAQSSTKKFDIQFQLVAEIKNINKPCLPCGRIGNKTLDSIGATLGIAHCNKVRISKKPATFLYFIKYHTSYKIDSIIGIYKGTSLVKNIFAYQ